jgi:hypothetical protein
LVYIVGDFNEDLIKHDQDSNCQNLIDTAANHGFVQIVSRPTRITDHSATLIDHVYTNSLDNTISCNIITHDITDHLATHTKIKLGTTGNRPQFSFHNRRVNREGRIFNEANHAAFKNLIDSETWEEITDDMDAQSKYEKFDEIYSRHYNSAYPLAAQRKRRKFERKDPKPWILPWLEEACNRKQEHYHNFVKAPTPENKAIYDKWDEFCEKHCNKARAKYYKKYFTDYKDNSRKQWEMINKLLNRGRKKTSVAKLMNDDGSTVNSPSAIAEKFNEYFSNIATNMKQTNTGQQNPDSYIDYLQDSTENTIYLRPTDSGEIHDIIKKFKNKATLDHKISALKIANENFSFTTTLSSIVNSSLDEGVFPQKLKEAKVVPIHKSGAKTSVSNYRPISLLTSFSKVYEKVMHARILDFLESNKTLYDDQYGFRPGRSCEHALLTAQNCLLNSLSNNQISVLLLLDYSKAFDLVDHSILIRKLEHYGIRGQALAWMKSYLENRTQYVTIDGKNSSSMPLRYGVPQGSILGPLLFIIYINDLPGISHIARFILYADDANIILTGTNVVEINHQLKHICSKLVKWVAANGLALNLKKTNYMIFARQKVDLPEPLKVSNVVIERKTETRFLGVILDDKLKWNSHITHLKTKMSRYIGILYKIKRYLPFQARLQIYHSFVQSHLNYCSLIWGFSTRSNIQSVFSKQKKGMRAIVPGFINYRYRDGVIPGHTKPHFKEYKILTVQGIIASNALTLIHKIRHFPNSVPSSIRSCIPDTAPVQGANYETSLAWLTIYNNSHFRSSLFFKGPMLSTMQEFSNSNIPPSSFHKIRIYKNSVKSILLEYQSRGAHDEWSNLNCILDNIPGLRRSKRIANI